MATFEVREGLDIEIRSLDASGYNLNTDYTELENIASMKTASRYYRQHRLIKELIEWYVELVMKDANDISAMAQKARELDDVLVVRITG